ncbi:MAG: hypothetical protein ACOC2K_03625 [Bacteroidota bacterium]
MGCEWKITAFFMHRRGRPGYHMLISNDYQCKALILIPIFLGFFG